MTTHEKPDETELIQMFLDRYLPREEIIHRLPIAIPIDPFWAKLTEARRNLSFSLPLYTQAQEPFRFVLNKSIENQCDLVAAMARRNYIFEGSVFESMAEEAVIDEAVYSSLIEGAFTSGKKLLNSFTLKRNL